jgi:hypothetical protein
MKPNYTDSEAFTVGQAMAEIEYYVANSRMGERRRYAEAWKELRSYGSSLPASGARLVELVLEGAEVESIELAIAFRMSDCDLYFLGAGAMLKRVYDDRVDWQLLRSALRIKREATQRALDAI